MLEGSTLIKACSRSDMAHVDVDGYITINESNSHNINIGYIQNTAISYKGTGGYISLCDEISDSNTDSPYVSSIRRFMVTSSPVHVTLLCLTNMSTMSCSSNEVELFS